MLNKKSFLTENFYIFIVLYSIGAYLSNDMFLPAISTVANDLNTSIATIQLTITSWFAGSLLVQLFAGPVSDSFGRKKALIVTGVVSFVGSIGCVFANDSTSFMVARFFEGIAAGAAGTVAISSILDYYEGKKAMTILSGIINVIMIVPIAGPILGAFVLSILEWHYMFVILAVVLGVALLMLTLFMPETLREENKAEWHGITTPIKLMYQVSKNIPFLLYCLSGGLGVFMFSLWLSGAPIILITNAGLSSSQYAIYQMPVLIGFLLGNMVSGQLIKRFPLNKMLANVHKLFIVVSVIVIAVSLMFDVTLYSLLAGLAIMFFFIGLLYAPKMNYALLLPDKYVGTAATFFSFTGMAIGMAATVYATTLQGVSNNAILIVYAFVAIISCAIAFFAEMLLKRREHELLEMADKGHDHISEHVEVGEAGSIYEHKEWLKREYNYNVHAGEGNLSQHDFSTN